jgi:hypothetical protein
MDSKGGYISPGGAMSKVGGKSHPAMQSLPSLATQSKRLFIVVLVVVHGVMWQRELFTVHQAGSEHAMGSSRAARIIYKATLKRIESEMVNPVYLTKPV